MQKHTIRKNTPHRRIRLRPIWLLLLIAFLFVLCGVFLTFAHRLQASTNVASISPQTRSTIVTKVTQPPLAVVTPIGSPVNSNKKGDILHPTATPVKTTVDATVTPNASTLTLIASTPQHTQLGVFALSSGGPLPVPESVLHPTNIARVMLGSTLVSVYAGSMSSSPQEGILCVLREDLTTGTLHLQVYQGPSTGGALTILSVQKSVLKIANTKMQGSFDLNTNTFQW